MAGRVRMEEAMSYISDELRRFSDSIDGYAKAKIDLFDDDLGCISYLNSGDTTKGAFTTKWFRNIADRIDAEMTELPRDKDGRPVHVGETVYDGDGRAYVVCTLTLNSCDGSGQWLVGAEDTDIMFGPKLLTHKCPDSWERIANELDEWRFEHMRYLVADDLNDLGLFAERIRRLAEREG